MTDDKVFEMVAILGAFVFGGVNLFSITKLSFHIGETNGKRMANDLQVHNDMARLQESLTNIQTEVKTNGKEFEKIRSDLAHSNYNVEHLMDRDKIIGERTHRIPSLETAINMVADDLGKVKVQFTSDMLKLGNYVDEIRNRLSKG